MKYKYVADGQARENPSTIEEAIGFRKQHNLPYETLASMEKSLKTMNLFDMQKLAIDLGVKPISDRTRLEKILVTQYKKKATSYGAALKTPKEVDDFNPEDYK